MIEVFKRLYLNDFGVYAEQVRYERVEVSPGGQEVELKFVVAICNPLVLQAPSINVTILLHLELKTLYLISYSYIMDFFAKLDGEILEEIGEKLKVLRKNHRYSQEELAHRIGVSRKHISDIEAGKGTSLLTFIKLLKEFNKSEKLLEILSGSSFSPKERFQKENK